MLRGALSISRRFPSRAAGSPCGWCSFSPLPSWPPWLACAGQRDRSTATATRCHLPRAPDRGQWFCSYFQMIHILLFPLPPKHFFGFYVIVSLHQPLIFPRRPRASEGSGRAGSCGSPEIPPFSRSPLNAAVNTLAVLVIRLQLLLLLLVSIYHQTVVYLPRSAYWFYFREEKTRKK